MMILPQIFIVKILSAFSEKKENNEAIAKSHWILG